MINFGTGLVVIDKTWTAFKAIATAKNLLSVIQYEQFDDQYIIFVIDAKIVYRVEILTGSVPDAPGWNQQTNDADKADFETNYKPKANESLEQKTNDNRIITATQKSDVAKATLFTHDWTNKNTWYHKALRIVDEVAAYVSSGIYDLAHGNLIDSYHGKITQEDFIKDDNNNSFRVVVKVNGTTKAEQDPHYGTGGDYTINYATGRITFTTGNEPATNDEIKATYHYATTSDYILRPASGKKFSINYVESQYSDDIIVTDTIVFQPYGYVDYFAPQLLISNGGPYASGTKIPLGNPVKYKSMTDFYNESVKTYPAYPAIGGSGWRGCTKQIIVCDWDYISSTTISSAAGMEIVVKLEHDTPFGGTFAAATFYCTTEDE